MKNKTAYLTYSHQSHESGGKYKSENGENTDLWIYHRKDQVLGGVNIPCRPVTPAVSPIFKSGISYDL
jgi:hypothetical protein